MNAADTRASRAIAAWMALTSMPRSATTAEIETFMIDVSTTSTNIAIASRIGSAAGRRGRGGLCLHRGGHERPGFGPRGLQDCTSSKRLPPAFGRRPVVSAHRTSADEAGGAPFGIRVRALRPSPSVRYPRSDTLPRPAPSGPIEDGAQHDRDSRAEAHPPGRPGQGHRERSLRGRPDHDGDAPRSPPDRRRLARPHPPHRHDGRAGAARRACGHHGRGRPRGPLRRLPEGPDALRPRCRALGGRSDRGGRGHHARDRCAGGRAHRHRPRAPAGPDRPRGRHAPGCAARPRRLGDLRDR